MLKLKLQYFGHLMWRTDSLEIPWCWERWRQKEKGTTEDEMVEWHHRSMDMSLNKLQDLVMDREASHAAVHGIAKSRHDWATELNWTELSLNTPTIRYILSEWVKIKEAQCLVDSFPFIYLINLNIISHLIPKVRIKTHIDEHALSYIVHWCVNQTSHSTIQLIFHI